MINLIGAWEFVRSTVKDAAGNELYDPMNEAKGMLIYTDVKRMAVQLHIPDKKYIDYYGYYVFHSKLSIVTHEVIGATIPELRNQSVQRKVKFYNKDHKI